MLRVRIDGGRLTAAQLRAIAEISTDLRPRHRRHHRPAERPAALDPDRGRPGDLAEARGRRPVDHRGLRRHPAGDARLPARRRGRGRDPRRHPGARRDPATATSATRTSPTCRASSRPRSPAAAGRAPTRSTTSPSSACVAPRARPRLRPVGRRRPVHQPDVRPAARRLRPAGRGRRGLGRRLSIFRDYGYRRLRNHARLKFLVADWGAEKFREVLETEYLQRALPDGPPPRPCRRPSATTSACTRRRTAASTSASPRRSAGSHGPALAAVADARRAGYGSAGSGPPPSRRLLVLDVPADQVEALVDELAGLGLAGAPLAVPRGTHGLHRHRVLQAGHRRDQGPGRDDRRAGEAAAGLRHPDHDQRQRLPELLRAVPDRRHRAQGQLVPDPATAGRSRASRCTSAGSSGGPRRRRRSAASCAG